MHIRARYLKIERPHCLVYTQQFCDENENSSRHPKAPTWPEAMLTTVRFSVEGSERTRVTVTSESHGVVKPEELAAFIKERGGMTRGWSGSFEKLDVYLASLLEKTH
jgi:uncharacterized protein YndB with AHSA1/START domain